MSSHKQGLQKIPGQEGLNNLLTNETTQNNSPLKPNFNFNSIPIHSEFIPIIQTKLIINTPGDQYEQEADAMAEKVMRTKELGSSQVNKTNTALISR